MIVLDFVRPQGDMDTSFEVSMGVPEDEMYCPHMPKHHMADRSPQHLQDCCGRMSRVPCYNPTNNDNTK